MCRVFLESLSGKPKENIMNRVQSGSYSKVTMRISFERAWVEIITKDRYIKGADVMIRGAEGRLHRLLLL